MSSTRLRPASRRRLSRATFPAVDRVLVLVAALAASLAAATASAAPAFDAPFREFPADLEVVSAACGDFDEDGLTDVVVSTASAAIDLVLMRQNPDHTFTAQGGWTAAELVQHLVAGDFNGDGHLDVAGIDFGGDLAVYFGDGYGGGGASVSRPAPAGALYLAVADLGSDAIDDLVTVSYQTRTLQTYSSTPSLLTPGTPYTTVIDPSGLGVGDLNGDGFADILLAHETVALAEVLYSNGTGGVGSFQYVPLGVAFGSSAAILDVNNDTRKDLLVGLSDGTGVAVCLNAGGGVFGAPTFHGAAAGSSNFAVLGGDLDADGDVDLVLGGPESRVLLNNGAGAFTTRGPALPPYVHGVTDLYLADLDGDARRDVVAYGNYGAGLLVGFGNGDGTFGADRLLAADYADALVLADLDGDSDADAVTVNGFTGALQTFARTGSTFAAPVSYLPGDTPVGLAQGHFDAGTSPDFATTTPGTGAVHVYLNNGAGALTGHLTLATAEYPVGVAAGDLNADGRDDLVAICSSPALTGAAAQKGAADAQANHGFKVFLNTGGAFAAPTFVAAANACPADVAVADVTGDGRPDLVAAMACAGQVRVYPGLGTGAFGTAVVVASVAEPAAIAVRDVDGDGDRDIVAVTTGGVLCTVPATGGGTFGAPRLVDTAPQALRVALADFDLDGRVDAAVLGAAGFVAVHPGLPGGDFGERSDFGVTSYPAGLVTNDFDGDGDQDLLVPNGSLQAFEYLRNAHDPLSAAPGDPGPAFGLLHLRAPAPNPASGRTRLEFRLDAAARVTAEVFDVRGRHVRTLLEAGELEAGGHVADWGLVGDDGAPVPAGVYFVRVRAGGHEAVGKVFVTR